MNITLVKQHLLTKRKLIVFESFFRQLYFRVIVVGVFICDKLQHS